MIGINERVKLFDKLFNDLQKDNSRNYKEIILELFKQNYPELIDDLNYIFETLAGKHPIGWTFNARPDKDNVIYNTFIECIKACEELEPKTIENRFKMECNIGITGLILEPVINRTLRLGISQLEKTILSPMLAKKYDGHDLTKDVYITEKLDGNRCIAYHDGEKWCFVSRSGKPMNVKFDMYNLPIQYVFDGEIMSDKQTELSINRCNHILCASKISHLDSTLEAQLLFNETSGLINRQGEKTGLVYNIFDIILNVPYEKRRRILDSLANDSFINIRIIPILYIGTDKESIFNLRDKIVTLGGEGIMLNVYDRQYEHKRTDALLKYKQVQTIDMEVVDVIYGNGKYCGDIGALVCRLITDDGKDIICNVGTGLSDSQREEWAIYNDEIIGKIVEIGYHEFTQYRSAIGTNCYSLRFPRLIRVRDDKITTSEY